jgi:MFS family permease
LMMPGMLPILLASFIFTAMQLCLRTFFTVYLVTNIHLSLVDAGLAFSVSQAAGMLGQIGWAAVSDRLLGTRWVMAVVGTLIGAAAILTAMMSVDWSFIAILAVAAVFGGSAAAFVPTVLGEVARRSAPDQVGPLTSGVQMVLMAGALVGPLSFGAVAAVLGFASAFILSAACTLVTVALLALTPRHRARQRDTARREDRQQWRAFDAR